MAKEADVEVYDVDAHAERLPSDLQRRRSSLGVPHVGHSHWLSGCGHMICANVGAGVLSLPNAVAWLGWVAGPLLIILSTSVATFTGMLLTECYHSVLNGRKVRNTTYKEALRVLGPGRAAVITAVLYLKYFLVTVGYTVVAASAASFIASWACDAVGKAPDQCFNQQWVMILLFGAVQLLLSQAPNLESVKFVSAIGAVMSISYSLIAMVMSLMHADRHMGSLTGRPAPPLTKTMGIFNAFGSIMFANASIVLTVDIMATLREPPRAETSMKKVIGVSYGAVAMLLYSVTGTAGYLALGDGVGSDVLTSFDAKGDNLMPNWLPLFANILVLIHFIPAYGVFAQPIFTVVEQVMIGAFPRLASVPDLPVRLVYRSLYVGITTVLAVSFPFFGAITGLIGAIVWWPTVVYAPIQMFLANHEGVARRRVVGLQLLNVTVALIAVCALLGSVYGFVMAAQSFKPFQGGGGH